MIRLDNNNNLYCTEIIENESLVEKTYPTDLDYTFESSTEIKDFSGNANDGTPYNITLSDDTNRGNKSAVFNGATSYIEIPTSFNDLINGENSFTIALGMKCDRAAARDIFLGNYKLTGASDVNVEKTDSGRLRFYWAGLPDYSSSVCITSNSKFYDIAFQYNKETITIKMFCDGVEVYSGKCNLSTKTSTSKFRIGGDSRLNNLVMFGGKMSYFKIYPYAVPLSDLVKMYKNIELNSVGQVICQEIEEGSTLKIDKNKRLFVNSIEEV